MKVRRLTICLSGMLALVMGGTFLFGQGPQPTRESAVRSDRAKLRARIVKLRTEVEMLRIDYELAHDTLMEEAKIVRGLKMTGEMMNFGFAQQNAFNNAGVKVSDGTPPAVREEDPKKAAEAAKTAEQEQKNEADTQAAIAERKVELARRFTLLSEKRLDLEDAERAYREQPLH